MIDLHSHILPGIDDGARSLDIALEMAEQAVSCGISHMVCTPHIHRGYFDNSQSSIEAAFQSFNEHVKRESIPLSLSFAAEVRVNELIPIWHKKGELPFLGKYDGKNVLLLEMPHSHIPQGLDVLIKWLLRNNIQPLIAHPERNRELIAENDKFNWLQRQGCLFQGPRRPHPRASNPHLAGLELNHPAFTPQRPAFPRSYRGCRGGRLGK